MVPRGRGNEEILPEEVSETENVLNSELFFTSDASNYWKYKKLKILWTHTQSYAYHKPPVKDFTGKDLFIC